MTPYRYFLLFALAAAWVWAAIAPLYRSDWFVENLLVFFFVPVIIIAGRYFVLSNVSYTLITIFMILHLVGSHYTYAETPIGFWMQDVLGANRNMYDRFVHFTFGFLLAYPMREVFLRAAHAEGFWGFFFPLDLTISLSATYELMEWVAVKLIASDTGAAFLGTQGDEWDAHKDILCATCGAFIAMLIIYFINHKFNPDFAREMKRSFRLSKKDRPLGEVELQEWAKRRKELLKQKTQRTKRAQHGSE